MSRNGYKKHRKRRPTSRRRRYSSQRKVSAKEERQIDALLDDLVQRSKHASSAEKIEIKEKLALLDEKIASGDVVPTLDEVEQMVDEIYGDQSKNETLYFQRGRRKATQERANWYDKTAASPDLNGKPWYKVPLEDAQEHSDQMYGDQSANETYYFEQREEGSESLPRWTQKDADRDVESYNVAPDQYRLKERKFDSQNVVQNWYEDEKTSSSYVPGLQEDGVEDLDGRDYDRNPGQWWVESEKDASLVPPDGEEGYFTQEDMTRPREDDVGPLNIKPEVDTHGDTGGSRDINDAPHTVQDADTARYKLRSPQARRRRRKDW